MRVKKVILLGESNYVLDVVLERHNDCVYLAQLAASGEIELVIPDYSFAEVEAKLREIESQFLLVFERAKAVLEKLLTSRREKKAHARRQSALDECNVHIHASVKEARDALEALQAVALPIAFTSNIDAAAKLRRVRGRPPHDIKDLEIYESILAFARLNQSPDVAMVFLERDVTHFDVPEVKSELAAVGVEIYFMAGEAVKRIRELLGK
jgi:hypothetical protein